jgi:SAM-dependent methyltransferase
MAGAPSPTAPAWPVIADLAGLGPATSVLDVGCGTGGFCALAAARGAAVHGVDGMPDRIARAARRVPTGDFRVTLFEHLPWPDDSFDVVTGFNSFQYALEPVAALQEACRVTRPGGALAVCKYGRPDENEFFALLAALARERVDLARLPRRDNVDEAIERLGRDVRASGVVPSELTFASHVALRDALQAAGIETLEHLDDAAGPFRQPDGAYRFRQPLKYRIIAV